MMINSGLLALELGTGDSQPFQIRSSELRIGAFAWMSLALQGVR
jgi:hypothetical protein